MYIFVVLTVLAVAFGTSLVAFRTSAHQIDEYYKECASDNAKNFASMVDGDYLMELRTVVEADEFQALRDKAEEEENEQLIQDYLEEHGLWEQYYDIHMRITAYVNNIESLKYLYLNAVGDKNADHDMYLIDDDTVELYETGYYEEREKELMGMDLRSEHYEPTISNGDWGWLCSAYYPVYTSSGEFVCVVGCDFDMKDVMQERTRMLIYLLVGAAVLTVIVFTGAVVFINKFVVKPLKSMTAEMEKFDPSEHLTYDDAGVMRLDIKSRDEIEEIYEGIRSMQMHIIDYLKDLYVLTEDKLKAENDIRQKEEQIGQLSKENSRDALTGVGSKSAYFKKIEELKSQISKGDYEFALVMVDINNLKEVNDVHGHKAGDLYIKGCCSMVCDAFKHSPVYRIGGDEFIVILQGIDLDNRMDIVKKLKEDFGTACERTDSEPWERFSAAVGMAENASDDMTVDLVFKRADKAMYEDKLRFKQKHGGELR